ncbi:asparagine synthase (glutamine-hydrolyzing) [Paenibacillus endophyticus]|uniref:asparagine synthase (glutamine-hydrolyzing) n=1 Tax=Paenibacillus endophyticus TaxID=1294268 RepID=A0A7W5C2V6_9BACL|nr:asparagine synthase-related protein [Paenibacillus endophyticus]MBB3150066.1 asparagine synthase (glutamine-hydrolyzing) [Paenibacillus endophyticus]
MSAIVGISHLNHEPIAPQLGMHMLEQLQQFPADHIDAWYAESVFLGCHAQWITPESVGETMPYYDSSSCLAITADAIIDNRPELFEKLQVSTFDRKDMTDSALILLSYQKWGREVPKHLIGDFAFVIWDEHNRTWFGARDFSGSRTLYYAKTRNLFAFSTVIQPLLSIPGIDKQLNEQWMSEFLAIPITTEAVDLFTTVYKNIGQVPPSHSFTVCNGELKFSRYSTLVSERKLKLKSNEEYEEAFRDVFQTAVSSRLRTHRQVGANLSGGLDSGSVVSFAAKALREQNKKLHTFSYVPLEDFHDWTPKSRIANERFNIQSTVNHVGNINEQYLNFPDKNPFTEIDEWLEIMETPYKFYENSYWVKGIYQQAHVQNLGVLLTGSRGNWTISWGPALDYQASLLRKLKLIQFAKESRLYSKELGVKQSRILPIVGKKAFPKMAKLMFTNNEPELPDLINPEFARKTNVYERLQQHGYDFWGNPFQDVYEVRKKQFEMLYYWNITGTVGCKQSLRYSVWERDATNDLRVIRFCLSVPEEQFVQNGFDRSLVRRSTKNYLPEDIRLNQKVRGIQGADGLHRMLPSWDILIDELKHVVSDPIVSEYLNIKELKRALAAIEKNPRPENVFETNFRILMRSLIFRRFIKKQA